MPSPKDPIDDERLVEIARVLRASRPLPDRAFTARLERELFPAARFTPRRLRVAFATAGAIAAVTASVLAAALVGSGPLGSGDDRGSSAKLRCRDVSVVRREPVPVVVRNTRGRPTIRYRTERIRRPVRRCR